MKPIYAPQIVSLDDVLRITPPEKLVYSGAFSSWWTVRPEDPIKAPNGMRFCPLGSVVITYPLADVLYAVQRDPSHYGRHGLRAMLAGFHGNIVDAETRFPTSVGSWDAVNALIDAYDEGRREVLQ